MELEVRGSTVALAEEVANSFDDVYSSILGALS